MTNISCSSGFSPLIIPNASNTDARKDASLKINPVILVTDLLVCLFKDQHLGDQ